MLDKYALRHLIRPLAASWIRVFQSEVSEDYLRQVCVAWELGHELILRDKLFSLILFSTTTGTINETILWHDGQSLNPQRPLGSQDLHGMP